MLSLRNVTVQLGERDIVQDVSLDVPEGKILVMIGPNGSGKTSILRAISGALPLKAGSIFHNEIDLNELPAGERAKIIAVVPQLAQLPAGFTVYDTVALGRTPYIDWLGRLDKKDRRIIDIAMEDTSISAIGRKNLLALSGGEQQRVKLARAMVQDAPVLILDEPTTHLDLKYALELLKMVRKLSAEKGIAVLMVLHDLNLAARFADEVAILNQGVITAIGNPMEVMTAENLSAVFHVPMRILQPNGDAVPVILPK